MAQGFTRVEAYSPVPIEDLNDHHSQDRTVLPKLVLAGGLTGMATGFALQYWASVIEYPMNIGGRPLASWTTFIVPSYELTILFAALTAAIGMIVLNGLPQPYHPVFNVERFSMASSDKFFLVIESTDPKFGDADVSWQHGREGSVRRCDNTSLSRSSRRRRSSPAAARTCTTRRATRRSKRARRSPTTARRARAGRHGRARLAARRRSALHRQDRRRAGRRIPVRDRPRRTGARPAALQHLLHAVPRTARRRHGMVVQRGLRQAASYHQDRLRQEKVGYFFDVITNGFGAMQGYAEQIPVRDRWLIVAYVRTLQLSQHASVEDVPADRRGALDAASLRREPRQAGGETLVSTRLRLRKPTRRRRAAAGMRQFGMIAGVLGVVLAVAGFFMSGARRQLSSRRTWSPTRSGWAWSSAASRC
jgi:hypothetical protein